MLNTGVIERLPQPEDDMAGGNSRVVYQVLAEDGQSDAFVPNDNEVQCGIYGDTSTCTNNACSNSIDTQVNRMLVNNLIPNDKLAILNKYGFIVNGAMNTSERFNAIKSGTQLSIGNYLYKPWDSARNDGMIPEAMLPYPNQQRDPVFLPQDYFTAQITDEMLEAAKAFKQVFTIQYEIVPVDDESLKYHLKHAPIAIITGYCPGWNSDSPVKACSLTSGHATMLYGYKDLEYKKDFDSYVPTKKKLAWDYKIGYAIKGVVVLTDMVNNLQYLFLNDLGVGEENKIEDVKALQKILFQEGVLQDSELKSIELIQKFGGYFGSATEEAVKAFQKKYFITPQSGYVGLKTRLKLNSLYGNV